LLDEHRIVNQRGAWLAGLAIERHFMPSLDDEFAILRKADVGDHGRCLEESFGSLAQPLDRAKLDLGFAVVRHVRVRRIERPICHCATRMHEQHDSERSQEPAHRSASKLPYQASESLIIRRMCAPSLCTW